MSSAYLFEPGISLWEKPCNIQYSDFATLTLIARSASELTPTWRATMDLALIDFPNVYRWRTIGYSLDSTKVQEAMAIKKISLNAGLSDLIQKNPLTKIISRVEDVTENFDVLDLSALAQPKQSALIFVPSVEMDGKIYVWQMLSRADSGLTRERIHEILDLNIEAIICRSVESDTHLAVQFVGAKRFFDKMLNGIREMCVKNISAADVSSFIND